MAQKNQKKSILSSKSRNPKIIFAADRKILLVVVVYSIDGNTELYR